MKFKTVEERFFAKVAFGHGPGACWTWTASLTPQGYATFWLDGGRGAAHRVVYEWCAGPIPDGLTIDHLCRNRACMDPAHMEPVTNRENVMRGVSHVATLAARTHCPRGHEFTEENTRRHDSGPSRGRRCRACDRIEKKYMRLRVAVLDEFQIGATP